MIILHNNKFVKKALLDATGSLGRGYGVFETLRTYGNKELPLARLHIKRIFASAKAIDLKIKYTQSELLTQLKKVVARSPHNIQRIKIMAVEEGIIIFSIKAKIDPKIYTEGVSLLSTKISRGMPEVKSISYLPSYLAHEKAVKKGYFDALLINEKEEVFEAAYANLFWFEGTGSNSILCTRKDQVLPGITRELVIKNSPFPIKYKTITLKQLLKKKEIFTTQSINLIVPIVKIDKTKIGDGRAGKNTKELINRCNIFS